MLIEGTFRTVSVSVYVCAVGDAVTSSGQLGMKYLRRRVYILSLFEHNAANTVGVLL